MSEDLYVVIDTETRNEGFDIKEDSKELLSCQIGDDKKQDIFYKHSDSHNFDKLKENIEKMVRNNVIFTGYNISFDLEMLKKFLNIDIPKTCSFEIMDMEKIRSLKKDAIKSKSLENVCKYFGIDASHKELMDKLSAYLKSKNPHWEKEAIARIESKKMIVLKERIAELVKKKAGGVAISKAYDEFSNNGNKNSLFYRYAMGDVICESKLFNKLREMGVT